MAMPEYQPKRLFTVEEANRALPLVRRIAEDISSTYSQMLEKHQRYESLMPGDQESASLDLQDQLVELRDAIEKDQETILSYAKELDQIGVLLKGEADGLVDFPSLRDGKIVFLCWKLGEPIVEFWHEIEAGFRGRKPLEPSLATPRAQDN